MKILLLDIETSPNTAYVWGMWKETIPLARLIESSQVLCWTAKWYGDEKVHFESIHKSRPATMLRRIHRLLDAADAVVTYNGDRFDLLVLNKEFLLAGLPPPAPYKSVDLYKVTRRNFRFVSNKLDYICQQLDLGQKIQTDFSLWVRCMEKNSEAWEKMEAYNQHDVRLLEHLYIKLRPWIKGHPNHSVLSGDLVCPVCGSAHYHSRGTAFKAAGLYKRYQCADCGKWFRDNKTTAKKEKFLEL